MLSYGTQAQLFRREGKISYLQNRCLAIFHFYTVALESHWCLVTTLGSPTKTSQLIKDEDS